MRLDRLFQKRATPETAPAQEPTPPQEFAALYEQAGQPAPEPEVLQKYATRELSVQHLVSHLKNIESARGLQRTISHDELIEFARYGIKNLSETRISAQVPSSDLLDLSGADLSSADLGESTFKSVNFSGANMRNVAVHNTHFYQSILNTAEIPSIMLRGKSLDLESGSMVVPTDDAWNIHKSDVDAIDNCDDCEAFNEGILDISSNINNGKYSRRGILLFQEGKPLGMLKLKGENTFLAMRTVRNTEGEVIFWKGMVYALEPYLNTHLKDESRRFEGNEKWRRADTENLRCQTTLDGRTFSELGRNNLRFIAEPRIFDRLDELTADIEAGKEPMVDIFE